MPQKKATVTSVISETYDTRTLCFTLDEPLSFLPGQFISVLWNVNGMLHRRPYSLANAPSSQNYYEITIKKYDQGIVSPVLHTVSVGDTFDIIGPFGRFTFENERLHAVFIGAGSGIVPLRSMLLHGLQQTSQKFTLLFSNKDETDIIYHKQFVELASTHRNFNYVPTLTRPSSIWAGQTGRIDEDLLREYVSSQTQFYLCGPPHFVIDMQALLLSLGVLPAFIKQEQYE